MSKLVIRTGDTSNDKKGDPLRTAFSKVNLNFTALFDFLAGKPSAETLPVTLPISVGGTGASTKQGARASLGITEVATKKVGNEEGDVALIGSYGFGTDFSPRAVEASGAREVSSYKSGEYEYAPTGSLSYVTLATRDSGQKYQLGIGLSAGIYTPQYRYSVGGTFSPWQAMLTTQNTTVTTNGFVRYCLNSAKLFVGSAQDQAGKALTFKRTAVGKYTLTATLDTSNWTLEVPMDYKGSTNFDVTLTQVGTALNVVVTKAGVAYDIPKDQWIDLHIK